METGRIFNIQKCSIRDGRGMRTSVFFKGCGLHCLWCANPEGISFEPEITLNPQNCIACNACMQHCPTGASRLEDHNTPVFERDKCGRCGLCADLCPTEARKLNGQEYTVDQLFKRIYQDRFYFQHSGGGVTFTGGEALMQPQFLLAICKKCREYGINVAIETCGCGDYDKFAPCLDYIDFIYFDLKHMDSDQHLKWTGQRNEHILENLRRISAHGNEIIVRTPVIPGINDSEENIQATAKFILPLASVQKYELLAYHKLGVNKYKLLGKPYLLEDVTEPTAEHMFHLVDVANEVLVPAGKKCFYNLNNDYDE